MRGAFSNHICATKARISPPSANSQPSDFYSLPQQPPCACRPAGDPAHLPLSHHFCLCRAVWGVISAKTFLWDLGYWNYIWMVSLRSNRIIWMVNFTIRIWMQSFEWWTSVFKCKWGHLNNWYSLCKQMVLHLPVPGSHLQWWLVGHQWVPNRKHGHWGRTQTFFSSEYAQKHQLCLLSEVL